MKSKKFAALSTLLFLSIIGVAAGTLSWFITSTGLNEYSVTGKSAGAYFAYGNGNASGEDPKDRPYGISHPRHLYNLAWLHYTGYFAGKQCYFELSSDISSEGLNMNGYILPPIGTENNPFVSNFNGNGKIIKNLTISNDETVLFSSSNKHPDPDSVTYTTPEIVGMFGVVGNLNDAYSGTYDSSVNSIYNLGLQNVDVVSNNTTGKKALAGIVAGYVDAPIQNVAVTDGSINIQQANTKKATINKTENLSDYTIIGYCEDGYKTDVQSYSEKIYGLNVKNTEFVVNEGGDDSGLGGSINMTNLFDRIYKIRGSVSTTSQVVRKTVTYDEDGTTILNSTDDYTAAAGYSEGGFRNYTSDDQIGTYSIAYRNSSSYMYMAGGHYQTSYKANYTNHSGYFITDGTNYLTFSNGALANTTNSNSATIWNFSRTAGTAIISCKYQNITYYLINDNGVLTISTTSNDTYWTITTNGNNMQLTNGAVKIAYYNSQWGLFSDSGIPYYVIRANGQNRYMTTGTNGGTPGNTTTIGSASHWYVDTANNNYLYYLNGNTKMYLTYYQRSNYDYGIRVYSTLNASYYYYFSYLDGEVKFVYGSYSYYLRYNSGWVLTDNSSYASTYVLGGYTPDASIEALTLNNQMNNPQTKKGPDYSSDPYATKTGMVYDANDTTYMPLNVVADGTQSDLTKYRPKTTNTGYITSGSTYDSSFSSNATHQETNMRVSKYGISNISGSYSSKTLNNIYTINESFNVQRIGASYYNKYTEFDKAKPKMKEILDKDTSNVYGLHFMNAQIDKNAVVNTKYALINGVTYNDPTKPYQLPANSIDFNLKEKGFINFFAGMYFDGNDSFFSLHHIIRNKTTNAIIEIKQINKIYSDTSDESKSYVYGYTDNKYSKPFRVLPNGTKVDLSGNTYDEANSISEAALASGYSSTEVFNVERIRNHYANGSIINSSFNYDGTFTDGSRKNVNNCIYYFEIPMNVGEYALGSVNGGTGGYLFYLDIGANARKIDRTTFVEKIVSSTSTTTYPNGVAFVSSLTLTNGVFDVTPDDSAYVTIAIDYNSTLEMSRTGNTVTVGGYNSTYIKGEYKKNTVTLADSSANAIAVIPKTEDSTIWRMQYYDYDPVHKATTITVITETTKVVNGGSPTTTTVYQQYDSSGTLIYDSSSDDPNLNTRAAIDGVRDAIIIYDDSEGDNKGKNIADERTIVIDKTGEDHSALIVQIDYNGLSAILDEVIYQLTASQVNNSAYYTASGYVVTFDVSSGSITITSATSPYDGDDAAYSSITVTIDGYVITITGLQVPYIPPSS